GTGERGDQGGGRGRVRDPHVAGDEDPGALVDEPVRGLDTGFDGRERLVPGQCRLDGDVAGTGADLGVNESRSARERGSYRDVDNGHRGAGLARERVDDRPAGQEIRDHLRGDLLRPRRDALRVYAM